jgi:hypothetical protein
MIVEVKRLVCSNHECRAEIIVVRKPAIEIRNFRCACGSEFKRIYHPPVITVLGTVPENLFIQANGIAPSSGRG